MDQVYQGGNPHPNVIGNFIAVNVPTGALTLNGIAYVFPSVAGTAGQVLATDGATPANLFWTAGGGGGGGSTLTFGAHLTSGDPSYNGTIPATITSDATNNNNPSTIVARDSNGSFSAGLINGLGINIGSSIFSTAYALLVNSTAVVTSTTPTGIGAQLLVNATATGASAFVGSLALTTVSGGPNPLISGFDYYAAAPTVQTGTSITTMYGYYVADLAGIATSAVAFYSAGTQLSSLGGTLTVRSGGLNVTGTSALGAVTCTTISASSTVGMVGPVTITGGGTALSVNNNASIGGVLTLNAVGTALSVSNNATISGTLSVGTVTVSGAETIASTLGVAGAATFTAAGSGLAVTNNATVGGTFGVTGLVSANGGLSVTGTSAVGAITCTTINATGTITGVAATFSGAVTASTSLSVGSGGFTNTGSLTTSGAVALGTATLTSGIAIGATYSFGAIASQSAFALAITWGTATSAYGYQLSPALGAAATITTAYAYASLTPTNGGGATAGTYYYYYTDGTTGGGITIGYAFYSGGNAPASFGGNVSVAATLVVTGTSQLQAITGTTLSLTGIASVTGVFTALIQKQGITAIKTTAYTVLSTDTYILIDTATAAFTVTLPAANAVPAGKTYWFAAGLNVGASVNNYTVSAVGGDNIVVGSSAGWSKTLTTVSGSPSAKMSLTSDGVSLWYRTT